MDINYLTRTVAKINLNSGSLKIFTYEKEGITFNTKIRPVIYDIYNHSNYNGKINFIIKASFKEGYTIEDVLKEYIEKEYDKESLIIAIAGALFAIPEAGPISITEGLKNIEIEKGYLNKAGFKNVLFNPIAIKSSGNSDIYIYIDNFSNENFIKENIGTIEEGKLIKIIK